MNLSMKKKVAFLPAHPAQLWLMNALAQELIDHVDVLWVLRDKDGLKNIADLLGLSYETLSKAGTGLLGNALEFIGATYSAFEIQRRNGIDLWFTKYGPGNMAGYFASDSMSFNDDDADVVPLIAWTSYPFARKVVVPKSTRMGRFDRKARRYAGFHELFYLHPNRFVPDRTLVPELFDTDDNRPFGLIRLSALTAHHDIGIRGISEELVHKVLEVFSKTHRMYISSEKRLPDNLSHLQLKLKPHVIHHALANAAFFVGDSQTMTAESAVLGTPAFRFSDFVGRLSYLDDLEHFGLAFGFKPDEGERLCETLKQEILCGDPVTKFADRRVRLLAETIDPVPFVASQILECLGIAPTHQIDNDIRSR